MRYIITTDKDNKYTFDPITMKYGTYGSTSDVSVSKPGYRDKAEVRRTRAPKVIKILLGDACNYQCEYCRQGEHGKKLPYNRRKISNLLHALNDALDLSDLQRVEYWGGEPLLYWKEIKELTSFFNFINEDIYKHITTNGSLFTEEIVDYICETPFLVKLSHDGPSQHVRTGDPLEKNKDLILRLHKHLRSPDTGKFYINSVLTKHCISPREIVQWYRDNIAEDITVMKIEPVIPYTSGAMDLAVPADQLERFSSQITTDLIIGDIVRSVLDYQMLWDRYMQMTRDQEYRYVINEAKCQSAQEEMITVDMDGNVTPCQVYSVDDYNILLGHISKFNKIDNTIPYPPERYTKCHTCPVVSLCRGVCPWLSPGSDTFLNCNIRYHTYMGIFKAFFYFDKQEYITDISTER